MVSLRRFFDTSVEREGLSSEDDGENDNNDMDSDDDSDLSFGMPPSSSTLRVPGHADERQSLFLREGDDGDHGNGDNRSRPGLSIAAKTSTLDAASDDVAAPQATSPPAPSMDHNTTDYVSLLRRGYNNKVPPVKSALTNPLKNSNADYNKDLSRIAERNSSSSVDGNSSSEEEDEEEEDGVHYKSTITETGTNTTNKNKNKNTINHSSSDLCNSSSKTSPVLNSDITSASYIAALRNKYKNTNTSKNKPTKNINSNTIIQKNINKVRRSSASGGARRSSGSQKISYSNASSVNSDTGGGGNSGDNNNSGRNGSPLFATNISNNSQTAEELYGEGAGLGGLTSKQGLDSSSFTTQSFRRYGRTNKIEFGGHGKNKFGAFGGLAGIGSNASGGGCIHSAASTSTPNTYEKDNIYLFDGSSMGDTMAAAAAVVRNGMKSQKHFKKGEPVLIALPVLSDDMVAEPYDNSQDQTKQRGSKPRQRQRLGSIGGLGDKSSSSLQKMRKPTVAPVNKYGYPKNEGKTAEQRQGPYIYVLGTVKHIHFREDARHYTVERADTGVCVRADTGWMESIEKDSDAERAALKASQTTELHNTSSKGGTAIKNVSTFVKNNGKALLGSCAKAFSWIGSAFKSQASKIVSGSNPYRCEISITTVNFLVACSIIVAFLDQVKHAFFTKDADFALGVLLFVAWIILAIELIFQVSIRPENYQELLRNEQAYNPSTVRYIDKYHLFFEVIGLLLVVPDFLHIFGINAFINSVDASIYASAGETVPKYILGYLYFFTTRLRLFCIVRYKRNHWINAYYLENPDAKRMDLDLSSIVDKATTNPKKLVKTIRGSDNSEGSQDKEDENNEDDELLLKAAKIGTALLVVNSHRILTFLLALTLVVPFIASAKTGGPNHTIYEMAGFLHGINTAVPVSNASENDCEFYRISVLGWKNAESFPINALDVSFGEDRLVVRTQLFPTRCATSNNTFPTDDFFPKECQTFPAGHDYTSICNNWNNATLEDMEKVLNVRQDTLVRVVLFGDEGRETEVVYNLSHTVSLACLNSVLLQFLMLALILLSLGYLRSDANKLVIMPLKRMLKIVLRYASNPLAATPASKKRKGGVQTNDSVGNFGAFDLDIDLSGKDKDKLGSYETEQLITAVAKITDLLRKCWGVAGAGIISSNLARNMKGDTVVFNPTVPGKLVYALFGFAGINDFGHLLRSLDKDVMTLINDIAIVIHNEVYRWGLGGSGQCNKNLGAAFLMVYRIGDFEEVRKKNDQAKKVIFAEEDMQGSLTSTSSRALIDNELNSIQLASLPGINAFGDRALLGLLKSFAGINRAKSVKNWERDYRVGGGVGAFSVTMSFGMDAGWAVEGAVGSGYKIDATYLSSNVNMASRMMSACKQYRLAILLSQAVEELLSKECRSKLRLVDRVYVKGSKAAQRIYTYDARHKGVPFFLNMRTDEQADKEAKNYSPKIWRKDQDLQDMRGHVSQEFITSYNNGLTQYLMGNWENAVVKLKEANEIMIVDVVAAGRLEFSALTKDKLLDSSTDDEDIIHMREEYGDGPCQALISYMENRNCTPPSDWDGVRPLTSK